MNGTRSADDRRHVRTSLIASLAVLFTLLMGILDYVSALDRPFVEQFALTGANETAAARESFATSAAAAAPASMGAGAAAETNEMAGCGCAEGCTD
jgi:hypothetical protein